MDETIDVALVDDHVLFVRGLSLLLTAAGGGRVRVVGTTDRARMALDLVRRCDPAVVIVDLAMPPPGGLEVIRAVHHRFPKVRILALSGVEGFELPLAALACGASGFLPKTSEPDRLILPLLTLLEGWQVVSSELLQHLLRSAERPGAEIRRKLDADEEALWLRIAHNVSTGQLAGELHVSERSAKRMVAALLRKLGVSSRIEAAALAGSSGLLEAVPAPVEASRHLGDTSWHLRTASEP